MKYVVLGLSVLWLIIEIVAIIRKIINKKRANKARVNAQEEETGKGEIEDNASNIDRDN